MGTVTRTHPAVQRVLKRIDQLNAIGIALSNEEEPARLIEQILLGAKDLTNADGGTLYSVTEDGKLAFEILRNDTLRLAMGGSTGAATRNKPLSLKLDNGKPNHASVVAHTVISGKTIN